MKTKFKIHNVILSLPVVLLAIQSVRAQTNLQYTTVKATDEKAIRLTWSSVSNEVYAVQCADALIDTNTGSITWKTLYQDYPSQGANTFWLDTGNYYQVPPIPHPKNMPMRFYRIVDQGADTTSDEPTVSITSPTNGFTASGSLTVSVAASTDQATLFTKLFVDGQEMPISDDGSNYVINTCEWGNGTHTLFATAKCTSGFPGQMGVNVPSVTVGHAVSAFVPVTFTNLITRISFSQPFFNPDAGQTQLVSAVFAANSDWTLQIQDVNGNPVRNTSGTGNSMLFNWDGKGDGGTNLSAGVYYYYIAATTNGLTSLVDTNDPGDGGGGSPPSPSLALGRSEATQLWAVPKENSEDVVPFALYPQGFDTNDLIIFRTTQSQVNSLTVTDSDAGATDVGEVTANYSGPSGQSAPRAPLRPPSAPAVKIAGTFGVAYQTFPAPTATLASPLNGFPVLPGQQAQHVKVGTNTVSNVILTMPAQPIHTDMANNFIEQMQNGAWQPLFVKVNDDLMAADLQGSGNIFNQVNLGLFICHGTYGTTIDYHANQTLDIYFSIESIANNNGSWVRLSDMNLGSANSATNGLRWMAIFACDSLRQVNYNSMKTGGQLPITSNLHLLLGTDSIVYPTDNIASLWARAILGLSYPHPQPIRQAWSSEARTSYGPSSYPGTIKFAAAGWADNWGDTLQSTNGTSGELMYESVQVYP